MSPKPRNKRNRELPARWRYRHGAYFYRVPENSRDRWGGKTEFRLGKTLPEAYKVWSERLEHLSDTRNMNELLDRYALEVVPENKPKTQDSKNLAIRRLRPVFGEMLVAEVKPRHAYKYIDLVTRKHGATSANRDYEVLCHSLSKAVEWGVLDRNALKGQVKKNKIRPRQRYVEDWEIDEALKVAHPTLLAYIPLKQMVGLRCSDMLRLKCDDALEDGLYIDTGKTGAKLLITWTDELRAAVKFALSVRPVDDTNLLFCTRKGKCYATANGHNSGFKSLWQRFMRKALKKTGLKKKFAEIDIRKKTASDIEVLEDAQRLLGHASSETTRRHYRLKPEVVAPHSLKPRSDSRNDDT